MSSNEHGDPEKDMDHASVYDQKDEDPDAEFGGSEAREKLERGLLRKLDARMSIMVIIYILNYVRPSCRCALRTCSTDRVRHMVLPPSP